MAFQLGGHFCFVQFVSLAIAMQLFYVPGINGVGDFAKMDDEEARHCIKVLRKRVGDKIEVVDGKGHLYEATIADDDVRNCTISIDHELVDEQRRGFKLTIAIAPPKNNERLEWFLEKATEIGIDRIVPMFTERSERRKLNTERLRKIMVSAMKQSGKALLPQLEEAITFDKLIKQGAPNKSEQLLIATCFGDERKHLKEAYTKGNDAFVLIGPEGDFTDAEVALALNNGFVPISLGSSRLRLETAGMVATSIINTIND